MAERPTEEEFEITEMDDGNLEEASGGIGDPQNSNCGPHVCNFDCYCLPEEN